MIIAKRMPQLASTGSSTRQNFCGRSASEPICSVAASNRLSGGDNDQMARQMKTMNTMMPLMSLFFCFVTPVGLGIYWIASAVCRAVQQFFINKHIENLNLEDIIAKNQEKVKKKREKMGVTEERIRQAAAMNTRSIQSKANVSSANRELELEKANAAKANAKPGSMAAKANLVKEFREKNNRK